MTIYNVKVTVVKRVTPEYIFDNNVPLHPNGEKYTVCTAFKEGDSFIVEKIRCPEGFCDYAWKDIYSDLRVLAQGGDHEGWVEKYKMYSCCTDGIRPVSFLLERIEQ
ncbi:MAG: TIGR04076 family protein [Promethearchaeota archaeon]